MNETKERRKISILRVLRLVSLAVGLLATVAVLFGCSFIRDMFSDEKISFTRASITMHVGDSFNVAEIVESDKANYGLSSSDSSVVSVDTARRVITAKTVGVAYITAETNLSEARLKVTVEAKLPDEIVIEHEGDLIQTMGNTSEVLFIPKTSGDAAKSSIAWYVNGKFMNTLAQGVAFSYLPTQPGNYVVSASSGGITAEIILRVFYAVSADVECNGELTQSAAPYTRIVFTVNVTGNSDNPDSYICWYEDETVIYAGSEKVFTYTPRPGKRTLKAEVNGNTVYTTDVVCSGAVTPNSPTIEFDDMYPHVYVNFDVVGAAQVEITSPGGDVKEYSQNSIRHAQYFEEGRMDVGSLITLCATSSSRRNYRFRVKSLGDGGLYTESGYSDYLTFTQLPNAAAKYIGTVIPGGDLYVTSEEEYVEVTEYYVFFREKSGRPSVSFDCYIAYDRMGSSQDLWNDAFPIAATSGLYSNIRTSDNGAVMHTSFTVSTVNAPSKQVNANASSYAVQLHAVLPHINYDTSKYRESTHTFPIDRREHAVTVEYSDELYLAAQGINTRPEPVAGSTAEKIYDIARDIVGKICTDDMTDVQKAHAIYDWIMWQVTYDNPAVNVTSGGEALSAYYLEGVFGDGKTAIGGVKYKPYAVCDGMSKAYALMCNIEGIPCVRVIGKAGKSLRDAGGHAWNKVFVAGEWYSVDCTWGDSQASMSLDGAQTRNYELGLHDHLFLTDAEMSSTHYEPYQTGETSIRYAPVTASKRLNVFENMEYFGSEINCCIASGENQQARLREIATEFASAYRSVGSVNVPGGMNDGVYDVGWLGFEIYVEDGVTLTDGAVLSAVSSSIKAKKPTASVRAFSLDNSVLVLVK